MTPKMIFIIALAIFSLVKIVGISKYTKLLVEQTKKNNLAKRVNSNKENEQKDR